MQPLQGFEIVGRPLPAMAQHLGVGHVIWLFQGVANAGTFRSGYFKSTPKDLNSHRAAPLVSNLLDFESSEGARQNVFAIGYAHVICFGLFEADLNYPEYFFADTRYARVAQPSLRD